MPKLAEGDRVKYRDDYGVTTYAHVIEVLPNGRVYVSLDRESLKLNSRGIVYFDPEEVSTLTLVAPPEEA